MTDIFQASMLETDEPTPELSTVEMRQILTQGSAAVFDVRPFMEFAISHIPGAINVPAKPGTMPSDYMPDPEAIGRVVSELQTTSIVLYCNGPYCGKSKRLANELVRLGYSRVQRYQLGIPVWRALGGITTIEVEGLKHVLSRDQTAVFVDATEYNQGFLSPVQGASNIPHTGIRTDKDTAEICKAKNDGRLPMEDHNTRIIVFGSTRAESEIVATAIVQEAFHNVAVFDGPPEQVRQLQEI